MKGTLDTGTDFTLQYPGLWMIVLTSSGNDWESRY